MHKKKNLFDGLGFDYDYHCLEHQDLGLIGKKHKHWRKAHKGDDLARVQSKCEGRHCIVCSPVEATENSMPDKSLSMRMISALVDKRVDKTVDRWSSNKSVRKEAKAQTGRTRGADRTDQRGRTDGSEAQNGRIKPADLSGPS